MISYKQYLLIKLAEECNEVAQAAIKCSLFGFESLDPREDTGETNLFKLQKEMLDITAVLTEFGECFDIPDAGIDDDAYIEEKQAKLKLYYDVFSEHSKKEYMLESNK